ncbi:MAG: hypothetical protein ABIP94_18350, partial [Planctomycetota bacterium]
PQSRARTQVAAIVVPQQLPALPANDPFFRAAAPIDLVLPSLSLLGADGLDLRHLQALRLLVLDASGGPAAACTVLGWALHDGQSLSAAMATQARSDHGGRAVLPVLPGTFRVVVLHDSGLAQREIDVRPNLPVQTLRLEPWLQMNLCVKKADGTPVQGAHLSSELRRGQRIGGTPDQVMLWNFLNEMMSEAMRTVRSDAQGRIVVRFMAEQGLSGTFRVVNRTRPSDPIELEARNDVVQVVVQ